MYILFILFSLYINVNGEQQHKQHAKLNHMPPDNVSYIIEEGDISDGNESIHLYVLISTTHVPKKNRGSLNTLDSNSVV